MAPPPQPRTVSIDAPANIHGQTIHVRLNGGNRRKSAIEKRVPMTRKWSAEEPEAIPDYLHGDTSAHQVKACCYYEYARTSDIFRKAWQEVDSASFDVSARKIAANFPEFRDDLLLIRLEILTCPSFPNSPWRQLSGAQRKHIEGHFAEAMQPLLLRLKRQSFILDVMGIFDRFEQQAASDMREAKQHHGDYPPIVGDGEIKYVALPFNYSQGKDAMVKGFSCWLDTDVNRKLFQKYGPKKPIDKQNPDSPARYKELLKYLASWRIYDELGLTKAKNWTRKNRRQESEVLRLRPFFGEKAGDRLNTKPLYKDGREWKDAIGQAKLFLKTEIECRPVESDPAIGLT